MRGYERAPGEHKYERLLGALLNEVHRRGLKGTTYAKFRDNKGVPTDNAEKAVSCCALGAVLITPKAATTGLLDGGSADLRGALTIGNDSKNGWYGTLSTEQLDELEELGNAFRDALDQ